MVIIRNGRRGYKEAAKSVSFFGTANDSTESRILDGAILPLSTQLHIFTLPTKKKKSVVSSDLRFIEV